MSFWLSRRARATVPSAPQGSMERSIESVQRSAYSVEESADGCCFAPTERGSALHVADAVLTDFEQDAACARRVDEEVEMAAGADLNVFGDEAGALGFQGFKG